MQKYKNIIDRLSNAQKIDLVFRTSYEGKKIDGTNILLKEFYYDESFKDSEIFACAQALDNKLFESFVVNRFNNRNVIYLFNTKDSDKKISDVNFINNSLFKICFNSLKKNNLDTALVLPNVEIDIDAAYYLRNEIDILKDSYVGYVITKNFIDKNLIINNSKYSPKMVIESQDITSIIKAINNGYIMAITNGDVIKELFIRLKNYKESLNKKRSGEITEEDFNLLLSNGYILDEEKLNDAIDVILEDFNNKNDSEITRLESTDEAYDEQTILYKNDGILPLKDEDHFCLIGEAAISEGFDIRNVASNYGLKCDYYLHGYSYEEITSQDILINDAVGKTASSIAILYLKNPTPKDTLDDIQLNLLKKLHEQERKVVTVVTENNIIDENIINLSNAVLRVPNIEAFGENTFDIIKGVKNPSGKTLKYTLYKDKEFNIQDETSYIYDVFQGFMYDNIHIEGFRVFDDHIEFVAKNDTKKILTNTYFVSLGDDLKNIICYTRVYLRPHEVKRICQNINLNAITEYDFVKHIYYIKGGIYNFNLHDGRNIIETSTVTLNNKEYKKVEDTTGDFFVTSYDSKTVNDVKNIKFKNFVIIFASLYFAVMSLILSLVFKDKNALFVIFIILFVLIFLFTAVYTIKVLKKKEHKDKIVPLEEKIKGMREIKKESSLIFKNPVENKKNDIDIKNTKNKDEHVETKDTREKLKDISLDEIENKIYDIASIEEDNSKPDFIEETNEFNTIINAKEIDIEKISLDILKYIESKGITTKLNNIKVLLAAIAATRIIFVNSNDSNLLKEFSLYLMEFFKNQENVLDMSMYKTFNEAIGSKDTPLSQFLSECATNKDKINLMYVENATNETYDATIRVFAKQNETNMNINAVIDNEKLPLTKNSFFIINNNNLSREDDASFTIDMDFAKTELKLFEGETTEVNISSFKNIINEHENELYLSEDYFQKFDEIAEKLNFNGNNLLSNRTTIDIDKLYIILHLAYVEDDQVVDYILRGRIVPEIKQIDAFKNDKNNVIDIVSKVFNKDSIKNSISAMLENNVETDLDNLENKDLEVESENTLKENLDAVSENTEEKEIETDGVEETLEVSNSDEEETEDEESNSDNAEAEDEETEVQDEEESDSDNDEDLEKVESDLDNIEDMAEVEND